MASLPMQMATPASYLGLTITGKGKIITEEI